MLSDLLRYLEYYHLNLKSDKFLLAVSGGMDSMSMLHAFISLQANVTVAHINHGLREESVQEASFVEAYCKQNNVPFFKKKLDPSIYQSGNVQNIARKNRYLFFEEILKNQKLDYICTAHHSDDSIESFLLNFSKGTGLKGLKGIAAKRAHILRPLRAIPKAKIAEYVNEFSVQYVEDSSNELLKYDRNLIRHEVIPSLKKIAPNLSKTAFDSIQNIKDSEQLFTQLIRLWKNENCQEDEEQLRIPIVSLQELKGKRSMLFELLNDYGFSRDQVFSISEKLSKTGLSFQGKTADLRIERNELILKKFGHHKKSIAFKIDVEEVKDWEKSSNELIQYVDGSKLNLPLEVKAIQQGDRIQVLGMHGKSKKISDIAIDKKMSQEDKENLRLVFSADTPVWLIGHALDERFKLNKESSKIYKLTASRI